MKLILLICLTFCQTYAYAAVEPKYAKGVVPLAQDNAYFRIAANPAPDFWALISYYVPQYNEYSCSAASLSIALNALLNTRGVRSDADENIYQEKLLTEKYSFNWSGLLSPAGDKGRHGVTLAQLAQAAKDALGNHSRTDFNVTETEVSSADAEKLAAFRASLDENEANPENIMLLHFAQDKVTGAAGGPYPHVSPVGAYDKTTRRVLLLDVDRKWYEPYWAPDTVVLDAMAEKTAAFGHGGYLIITTGK